MVGETVMAPPGREVGGRAGHVMPERLESRLSRHRTAQSSESDRGARILKMKQINELINKQTRGALT